MITNKRLLVLWGIIVIAYGAIMVFTWLGLTVAPEKRAIIYETYLELVDDYPCTSAQAVLMNIARNYSVTDREAVFSVREGLKAHNLKDPCGRYYP